MYNFTLLQLQYVMYVFTVAKLRNHCTTRPRKQQTSVYCLSSRATKILELTLLPVTAGNSFPTMLVKL